MTNNTFSFDMTPQEGYDLAAAASTASINWGQAAELHLKAHPDGNVAPFLDKSERFRQLAIRLGQAAQMAEIQALMAPVED